MKILLNLLTVAITEVNLYMLLLAIPVFMPCFFIGFLLACFIWRRFLKNKFCEKHLILSAFLKFFLFLLCELVACCIMFLFLLLLFLLLFKFTGHIY